MKRLLLFVIVGAIAAVRLPAAGQQTVELLPKWKKGDRLRFEVVKSRERSETGKPTRKSGARTPFEIEVLDTTRDSFVLAWTWGQTTISDPGQAATAVAQRMANLLTGFRMVLDLDSDGAFQGVRNWEEMRDVTSKFLEILSAELKAAGGKQQMIDAAMGQVASMFRSREQINQFAVQEPQLFFMLMGAELEVGKPFEIEDTLPNPLGGEPFPTRARVVLTALDKGSGMASVTFHQTVEPKEARRIMENTLRALSQRLGKPAPDTELLKMLNLEDTAEFEVETSTGWVRSMKHSRLTKSDAGTQRDTVAITRTKGEK